MFMFSFFRLSSTNTSDEQSFGLASSRLTTTGPGPSSMRNQDQYAVIHISCFPANYSENLLRRHFSIEFVTLTVYTNRSGGKYAIGVVESTSAVAILQCINNTTIDGRRVRVLLLIICCLTYNFLLLSIFFRPKLPDQVGTPNKRLSNKRIEMT